MLPLEPTPAATASRSLKSAPEMGSQLPEFVAKGSAVVNGSTTPAFAEPATTTAAIEAIIEEVRILNILEHCPC
jgi:hypothetical protein